MAGRIAVITIPRRRKPILKVSNTQPITALHQHDYMNKVLLEASESIIMITPAGGDGAVEPERVLSILRPAGLGQLRDVEDRQAVVYVAFHIHLSIWLVGVHVDQSGDHV